ncbi:MAG: ROK family protein, partial [bacterium]|nr:ROK family protein [bacterium]
MVFVGGLIAGKEVEGIAFSGSLDSVEKLLDFVCDGLSATIKGVSYAMAGKIKDHNIVVKSPNIHMLDGKALADLTEQKTGKPCIVANDMEAAVMGMAALLPELNYFMGITWSSGIGLRFYQDGKILADSEGGHIPLDPSPYALRCGCGVRGCAESILGGKALQRRIINETMALGIDIPKDVDPCKTLDRAYKEGRSWAINIYDLVSTGMAAFLANEINLLRIPAVVWKGSFAINVLPLIGPVIRAKMKEKLFDPNWAGEVKFLFSPKPDKDGLIGAAELFE